MTIKKTSTMKNSLSKWLLSILVFLFLLMDSMGKFFQPEAVVKGSEELGFNPQDVTLLGIILLVCSVCYMIPKLSVIGAVLLTGYLGGAVAIHIQADNPLFTHTLFPVYVGILAWLGLYLRNRALANAILKPE